MCGELDQGIRSVRARREKSVKKQQKRSESEGICIHINGYIISILLIRADNCQISPWWGMFTTHYTMDPTLSDNGHSTVDLTDTQELDGDNG